MATSNHAPSKWPDLFRDPLLASAGLDHLMHRAEVVVIPGASFRARPPTARAGDAIEPRDQLLNAVAVSHIS